MLSANQISDKINRYLKDLTYSRNPQGLYDPIEYVLSLGGKRIRPTLMIMAYELFKENADSILDQAAGVEIYHNFTLLHAASQPGKCHPLCHYLQCVDYSHTHSACTKGSTL